MTVKGDADPVVGKTVPGKAPSAFDNSTVKILPVPKLPVLVNTTLKSPPAQTAAGVTLVLLIVCANEEAAARSVIMQARNPFLINVLFMYPSNIYSLTCSTCKVRDIFLIHSHSVNEEHFSFPAVMYTPRHEYADGCVVW